MNEDDRYPFLWPRSTYSLDWNNPTENARVQVAIVVIRLPARVYVTDPRYGGAITINPGKQTCRDIGGF